MNKHLSIASLARNALFTGATRVKAVFAMACITAIPLVGCSSVDTRSAYPSGWSARTSAKTYSSCAPYHLQPDMPIEQNLDGMVRRGELTAEQADRVRRADVRVGDPECAAYAAFGLRIGEFKLMHDKQGAVLSREVTYVCANSNAPCPGVVVTIVDGKVVGVRPYVVASKTS